MEEAEWRRLKQAHHERVMPWVSPRLQRRAVGLKHPVDDFLFDYYPFSPGRLLTWHPGHGVELEGDVGAFHANPAYERTPNGGATASLAWLNPSRRARLALAVRILDGTSSRAANTGCFALHEWAMVYGLEQKQIRHEQVPLRVTPGEVRATVDSIGLRCTHIDAYRFYTEEAQPLNATTPTRESQPDQDQPGCLHTAMDLNSCQTHNLPRRLLRQSSQVRRCGRRPSDSHRVKQRVRRRCAHSAPDRDSGAHRAMPGAPARSH